VLESFRAFGWWTVFGTVGLVLAAAYNLRAVRSSVQGPIGEFSALPDLGVRETSLVVAFSAGILALGIQPMLLLSIADKALLSLSRIAGGGM
jgi:NADH:ubiquinone oxidoreductase subunit 4 (subunit M)